MSSNHQTPYRCLRGEGEADRSRSDGQAQWGRHTMISSRPNSSTAKSTASFISFSTPTSVLVAMALTFGYLVAIRAATVSAALILISTKRTFAPSEANNKEVSIPIPLFSETGERPHLRSWKDVDGEMNYDPAPVMIADCVVGISLHPLHCRASALTLFWRRPGIFAGVGAVGRNGGSGDNE